MATASERLRFVIEGDAKSFVKATQDAESAADKNLGKAQSHVDKLGAGLTKFGAGAMAFAGAAGVGLVKLGTDAAGYAVEMGKAADSTGLTVEQFSRLNEVAGDLGIETSTVEKSLGFMNKTLGLTPEKFKEFGAEVARTKDGTVDANQTFLNVVDRLNAIKDPSERAAAGSKLLGRGWQEMGELIAQGSDKLTSSLAQVSDAKVVDEGELARARDFRAAIDQMKDAFQDLAINIGQGVMPLISGLAKAVGGAVDLFGKLDAVTSGAAGSILGIGTAALGAAGALSFVAGKVITARSNFQKMFTAVDGDGVRSLNKFGAAAKAATPAVIGLGVAVAAWEGLGQVAADSLDNVADAASNLSTVADEELVAQYKRVIVASAGVARNHDSVADSVYKMAKANREGSLRLLEYLKATGAAPALINTLQVALGRLNVEAKQGTETTDEFGDALDGLEEPFHASTEGMTAAEVAQASLRDEMIKGVQEAFHAADAVDDLAEAEADEVDAAERSRDARERVADITKTLADTTRDLHEAELERVADAQKAIDADLAYGDTIRHLWEHLAKYGETATHSADETSAMRDEIIGAAKDFAGLEGAASGSKDNTDRLIESLSATAKSLAPDSELRRQLDAYIMKLLSIPANVNTVFSAVPAGGVQSSTSVGHRAGGGGVSAGGAYVVGENGPELLVMGGASGNVIPNGAVIGAAPAGGVTVHLNGTFIGVEGPAVERWIVGAIKDYKRRGGQL